MAAVTLQIDSKFHATAKQDFIQMFLASWRQRGYELVQIVSGKTFVFKKIGA